MKTSSKLLVAVAALLSLGTFQACENSMRSSLEESIAEDQVRKTVLKFKTESVQISSKQATSTTLVIVDSAKVLVEELSLEHANDRDSLDFVSRPFVLNLNPNAAEQEISLSEIPFGTYDEFEIEIDDAKRWYQNIPEAFFPSTSANKGYSVLVYGTVDGEAFTYKSDKKFGIEIDLDPPMLIDEGNSDSLEMIISVNLDEWFVSANGQVLNPLLRQDEVRITSAIRRSFRLNNSDNDEEYRDDDADDQDGEDDSDDADDQDGDDDSDDEDDQDGDDDSDDADDQDGDDDSDDADDQDGDDDSDDADDQDGEDDSDDADDQDGDDDSDNGEYEDRENKGSFEWNFRNTGLVRGAEGEIEYELYANGFKKLEIEVEDLPIGVYNILVEGQQVAELVLRAKGRETEGKVMFSNPQRGNTLLLDFDPMGKTIEIAQQDEVYLSIQLVR